VLGSVALWGRTIEHAFGYRSEFGYPQRLRLICPVCFSQRGSGGPPPSVTAIGRRGTVTPLCDGHLRTTEACGYRIREHLPAKQLESRLLAAYAVEVLPI
jgi:hypothetical protein